MNPVRGLLSIAAFTIVVLGLANIASADTSRRIICSALVVKGKAPAPNPEQKKPFKKTITAAVYYQHTAHGSVPSTIDGIVRPEMAEVVIPAPADTKAAIPPVKEFDGSLLVLLVNAGE